MKQQTTWIYAENFMPWLELLAHVGEAELDEGTRIAFEGGLNNTDFDENSWYELPLGAFNVGIAREESGKVFVSVEAPQDLVRAVDAVTLACASYRLGNVA